MNHDHCTCKCIYMDSVMHVKYHQCHIQHRAPLYSAVCGETIQ